LGQECQPFAIDPPAEGLFDPKKVAIVGNGRCASSCSLFSVSFLPSSRSPLALHHSKPNRIRSP
jgi:hypothetical protein